MKFGILEAHLGKFGKMTVDLTIITPCFNESQSVELCANEIKSIMISKLPYVSYEHIFIDNCSTDGTDEIIKRMCNLDKKIKLLVNSKNVGAFKSIYLALNHASGEAIIPMYAADLQDPAYVIEDFYKLWKQGSMIVFGVRKNRRENIILKSIRTLYYRIIQKLANNYIPINAGEFLLADKRIVDSLLKLNDHQPYIRGLIAATGAKYSVVEYFMKKRVHGKTKTNLIRLIDIAVNGLISTSRIPARLILIFGFVISCTGMFLAISSLLSSLFLDHRPLISLSTNSQLIIFLSGIQIFFLGLIGEYVLSIHSQVRREPESFFLAKINFEL